MAVNGGLRVGALLSNIETNYLISLLSNTKSGELSRELGRRARNGLTVGRQIWYDQVVMSEESALSTFRHLPADKQERVLDAALAEFAEQGYQAGLAEPHGGPGGDRQGLALPVFPQQRRDLLTTSSSMPSRWCGGPSPGSRKRPWRRIFLSGWRNPSSPECAFSREHPRIFSLYLKIQFDNNVPFREEFLAAVRRHATEYFASLVRRAQARGELRPGVPQSRDCCFSWTPCSTASSRPWRSRPWTSPWACTRPRTRPSINMSGNSSASSRRA